MKQTIWILFFALAACNTIISGDELTKSDIQQIQKLGLLEKDETILRFYSEYKKSVAGNFFTNKRIASYWQDENDKSKNNINIAYFKDIISIDTVYNAGATYSPYMNVMRKDSSKFKVCFDGEKNEIRKTFMEAIAIWKENQ
jgi:hypothetical protein